MERSCIPTVLLEDASLARLSWGGCALGTSDSTSSVVEGQCGLRAPTVSAFLG